MGRRYIIRVVCENPECGVPSYLYLTPGLNAPHLTLDQMRDIVLRRGTNYKEYGMINFQWEYPFSYRACTNEYGHSFTVIKGRW